MKSHSVESALVLQCPVCGTSRADTLELLGHDEMHRVRCDVCMQHYVGVLKECLRCGGESLFVWTAAPADATLAELACLHCAQAFNRSDNDDGNDNDAHFAG